MSSNRITNGHAGGNGKPGRNTTVRLAEARELTPPPDPVAAVQKSLVMAMYGCIGEDDVEALIKSIKEKALAGDKASQKLLLDLVSKAAGARPAGPVRTVEKVVMSDPGTRQLRLLCAYAIHHEGAMSVEAIAQLVGMTADDAANLVDGCWFEETPKGVALTAEGRQQVG